MSTSPETTSPINPIAGSIATAEAPLNLNGIPATPAGDQVLVTESQIPAILANSSRGSEVTRGFGLPAALAKPVGDFFSALGMGARGLKIGAANALVRADVAANTNKGDLAQSQLYRMQSEQALADEKANRAAIAAAEKRFGATPDPTDQLRNIITYSPDKAAVNTAQSQLDVRETGPVARTVVDPRISSY